MQSRLVLILRRCNNSVAHKYPNPNSTVSQQDLVRCFQTLSKSKLTPTGRGRVGNNTTQGYVSPIIASSSMRSSISTQQQKQQEQEQDDELFHTESISAPSSSSSTNTGFMTRKDTNHSLDFTNASIKRLLQEELLSIEKSFQNISSPLIDDNIMTKQGQNQIGNKIATDKRSKQQQQQPQKQQQKQPTMAELIHKYQKNNNESKISPFLHQPPPDPETTPLDEIQEFFEFQSQQETVSKYEAIINSARERSDYTSLSFVQRNLLNWYTPLRQKIIEEQEYYFTKKGNSITTGAGAGAASASIDDEQGDSDTRKGINKYGPYLCTLQAEKLAILTTHEATMFSLFKGGDIATLVTMAIKISDAIEAEVNVQRLLKMRMDEKSKLAMKNQSENNDDEDNVQSSLENNNNNNIAKKITKSLNDEWMYGPSHLQRFVDELNRSNPGRKGKVRIQRANRRAMQLLESAEPWPTSDKVALGVVLIKMLLDTAKVNLGNHQGKRLHGNEGIPAFTYEKKWVSENNLVGCVTMNEDFYKMVVEDKFCSLDAFATRHKPMVIPPKDWSSFNDGGYMVLETEFMRSHGCHIQKVRKILF